MTATVDVLDEIEKSLTSTGALSLAFALRGKAYLPR